MKRLTAIILILALCLSAPCALAERGAYVRTPISGSDAMRSNIELAASSISGMLVRYGEDFSFNDAVGPRSERYGYEAAKNGRGVQVIGGGAAQVASTLYMALNQLRMDVEFTELHFYGDSFTGDYVSSGSEAIMVDYNSGSDFSFVNYEDDMYIEMWTTDSHLYCSISLQEEEISLEWQGTRRPVASASIWIDGSEALYGNILNAASSINDTVLSEGDLFSFNESVGPRSEKYGYEIAVNGRGVEVVGGGVAQVASVIWLAVKNLDGVAIVEKSTYGSRYNQSYVSSSNDAILTDYSNGTDFSFRNTGSAPLRISTYVDGDVLKCEIYRD
ncbi:MAG: VanW family protein [Clostridia bacterium]|nr:VanW family protein [Clostridia bacterium]